MFFQMVICLFCTFITQLKLSFTLSKLLGALNFSHHNCSFSGGFPELALFLVNGLGIFQVLCSGSSIDLSAWLVFPVQAG